jgi:hypothetical protein
MQFSRLLRFLSLAVGSLLLAQLVDSPSEAHGQVVQLPSYQFFSTDSSVWVPDRGTASLGGVSRSSTGSNEFGPPLFPGNRSYGSQTSATRATVSAQIHDFAEMDEALLAGSPAADGAGRQLAESRRQRDNAPRASVADLAARREATQAAAEAEAAQLLERGLKAQADGKPGPAKIYLQMAAKRSTGKLKQQVLAALAAANASPVDSNSTRVGQNHGNRTAAAPVTQTRN